MILDDQLGKTRRKRTWRILRYFPRICLGGTMG